MARGFAGMTAEQRKKIARMGGAAVPADKRSFSQNRPLARSAGSEGGKASRGIRRFASDPEAARAAANKRHHPDKPVAVKLKDLI